MIHLFFRIIALFLFTTSILVIPFISILFKLKFQRQKQITKDFQNKHTPIFDKFHSQKTGTPVGGDY